MEGSEYTKGALKAAKLIVNCLAIHGQLVSDAKIATIIDRETGAKELLEALECLKAHVGLIAMNSDVMRKVEAAIRKAKGGE